MRANSSCLFEIGQSMLVEFNFCFPTRFVFLTLVSHCWWSLLVRFHSSCLFDIGQSLVVDFHLCVPTRLVFLTLVSHGKL